LRTSYELLLFLIRPKFFYYLEKYPKCDVARTSLYCYAY